MLRFTTHMRVAATSALVLSSLALAAPASAAGPSGKLAFSGALSGTLVLGPTSGCDASTNGVTLSSMSGHLSSTKFKTWSVAVYVTKVGTYSSFKFLRDSFVLLTSNFTGWVATKGIMTVTATGGNVNATLAGHEGQASGTLKVKGSWKCTT